MFHCRFFKYFSCFRGRSRRGIFNQKWKLVLVVIVIFFCLLLYKDFFLFSLRQLISQPIHDDNDGGILQMIHYLTDQNSVSQFSDDNLQLTSSSGCILPYIEEKVEVVSDKFHLNCGDDDNIVHVRNGKLYVNILPRHNCFYQKIISLNDFETILDDKAIRFRSGDPIPHDYLKVTCFSNMIAKYEGTILGIAPKKQAVNDENRRNKHDAALPYNVAILGYDSTSRRSFKKYMPISYRTFIDDLGGTVFRKHTIVGDGTTSNLLAIFTGKLETELPEARRRMPNAKHVDSFPWIYKDYKRSGYVTLHAEDQAEFGTFQFRLMGWNVTPTDHYARPYYLHHKYPRSCHGKTAAHKVMFDLLHELYSVYDRDVKKFAFIFYAESSHEDNYGMTPSDNYFSKLLMEFKPGGKFDNTILFLLSDHGNRYSPDRAKPLGKYEERLPMFGIHLPTKLKQERPDIVENIQRNSQQLTNQRDVYATLLHILGQSVSPVSQQPSAALSLFSHIPSNRTCTDARIRPHWCMCTQWKNLPASHPIGRSAVQATIDFINGYTQSLRSLCSLLEIKSITNVEEYSPNRAVLSYIDSKDIDGYYEHLSDKVDDKVIEVFYRVTFVASPGDAIYEATIQFNKSTGKYILTNEDEISRTNKYKNWIKCLQNDYPQMRRFCICKDAL